MAAFFLQRFKQRGAALRQVPSQLVGKASAYSEEADDDAVDDTHSSVNCGSISNFFGDATETN